MFGGSAVLATHASELQETLGTCHSAQSIWQQRASSPHGTTGGRQFIAGNGGSAGDRRMAADLSKNTAVPGFPRLRVVFQRQHGGYSRRLATTPATTRSSASRC